MKPKNKIKMLALCALAAACTILQSGCQSNHGYIGIRGGGNLTDFHLLPSAGSYGWSHKGHTRSSYRIRYHGYKLPDLNFRIKTRF